MLTLALAATLVGFGLLVVALITSNFWLAVACIVVCAIGLLILLADALRSGRRSAADADEPLFTIRDDAPQSRPAPLLGDESPAAEATPPAGGAPDTVVEEYATVVTADTVTDTGPADVSDTGLGGLVVPGATAPEEPEPVGDDETVTGDANDYIKSVTGSFPVQSGPIPSVPPSSGSWPVAASPFAQDAASEPGPAPAPVHADSGPDTGPIRAQSPYVGRRRRHADTENAPDTGETPAATGPEPAAADPEAADTHRADAVAERAGDGIVVHDHTGPLPKISYAGDEE
ncbi:hypothetical protein [Gordonia sp. FQ]|uniref:hypothetical protein n=1 Tax=Gordonia sp. FQ TaxID=3446634 RepID=UPI003F83DB99